MPKESPPLALRDPPLYQKLLLCFPGTWAVIGLLLPLIGLWMLWPAATWRVI